MKSSFDLEQIQNKYKDCRPNFIIIGTAKAGTTSLYKYLTSHPMILPASKKEIFYFNFHWDKDSDWYLSHFPTLPKGEANMTGEASPSYFHNLHVPQRIYNFNPHIKLVLILRNPIDKIFSWYNHRCRVGLESSTLEIAIDKELSVFGEISKKSLNEGYRNFHLYPYIFPCLYIYHLHNWLNVFSQRQILILRSKDLLHNTQETVSRCFDFLEIPNKDLLTYRKFNSASYSDNNKQLKQKLFEYFKPHNDSLEDFTKIKFNWSY